MTTQKRQQLESEFENALELLKSFIEIPSDREYDGIIVKKLASSNVYVKDKKDNTTHIAITGAQMDMFPYIRANKYFECDTGEKDVVFKKYLFLRLPFYLHKSNVEKLEDNTLFANTKYNIIESLCSVVGINREKQKEQIQLSLINQDSPSFVTFRKLLHEHDYLVICKIKNRVAYDCFGIKASEANNSDSNIEVLNSKFFYLPTLTAVEEQDLVVADGDNGKDHLMEDLMDETLDNKEWIFLCLEKLKEYKALDKATIDNLTNFNYCNTMFKLYHTPVLISDIDATTANRVYSKDKFTLNNRTDFFVSKEWFNNPKQNSKSHNNRILFTNWVLERIAVKTKDLKYVTNVTSEHPLNRIIFGAPGTGKSYLLESERENLIGKDGSYERVTLHPDYTYADFVGCYKPVPAKDADDKDTITYKYVPGPFMRMLVEALLNPEQAHLLIIEEINRANVAAVFGDVFQLLDRDENGVSEYEIQTSEDMRKYLADELKVDVSKVTSIKIPNNLFLWATMNSADQGVYPMDTAFKRRWNFEYIGINDGEDKIKDFKFNIQNKVINWNELRVAINNALTNADINEDKLLGPFFIGKKILDTKDNDKFINAFCNKVIMYLFEDAARMKRDRIFVKKEGEAKLTYSKLCSDFKTKGIDIFVSDIKTIVNVTDAEVADGNP